MLSTYHISDIYYIDNNQEYLNLSMFDPIDKLMSWCQFGFHQSWTKPFPLYNYIWNRKKEYHSFFNAFCKYPTYMLLSILQCPNPLLHQYHLVG